MSAPAAVSTSTSPPQPAASMAGPDWPELGLSLEETAAHGEEAAFRLPIRGNLTSQELLRLLHHYNYSSDDSTYDDWKLDYDILHNANWKTIVVVLYVVAIVFGLAANILIVVVIARYRQLHTVTNVFIVSLALADIALCVFNMPLQLHYQVADKWIFGAVLCQAAMSTFGVPMLASSIFILMIAVDRYLLIVYPFKRRMTVRCAVLIAAAIVVATLLLALPLSLHLKQQEVVEPLVGLDKKLCVETWTNIRVKQVYAAFQMLAQFVLPLLFTSVFYARICQVLRRRPIKKHDTRRSLRTNRILIAVVCTFTLCWLPWNLYSVTIDYLPHVVRGKYLKFVDLLLKLFAMGSACVNPFLYGWLNDNFKKELGRMLGYKLLCCRPPGGGGLREGLSMGYFSRTSHCDNHTIHTAAAALPLNSFAKDRDNSPV